MNKDKAKQPNGSVSYEQLTDDIVTAYEKAFGGFFKISKACLPNLVDINPTILLPENLTEMLKAYGDSIPISTGVRTIAIRISIRPQRKAEVTAEIKDVDNWGYEAACRKPGGLANEGRITLPKDFHNIEVLHG